MKRNNFLNFKPKINAVVKIFLNQILKNKTDSLIFSFGSPHTYFISENLYLKRL